MRGTRGGHRPRERLQQGQRTLVLEKYSYTPSETHGSEWSKNEGSTS